MAHCTEQSKLAVIMSKVAAFCKLKSSVPAIVLYRSYGMATISLNVPSLYLHGTDQVDVLDQIKTTVSKGHYASLNNMVD